MKPTNEAEVRTVMIPVCELCITGEGGECHTPGCSFFLFPAPSEGANSMGRGFLDDSGIGQTSRHIGRSFVGHPLEDECPCEQAPCGLVDTQNVDPNCDQHGFGSAKTIRQMHNADLCVDRRTEG